MSGNGLDSDAGTTETLFDRKLSEQVMSTSVDSSCGCGIYYHTDGWIAAAGTSRSSGNEAGKGSSLIRARD